LTTTILRYLLLKSFLIFLLFCFSEDQVTSTVHRVLNGARLTFLHLSKGNHPLTIELVKNIIEVDSVFQEIWQLLQHSQIQCTVLEIWTFVFLEALLHEGLFVLRSHIEQVSFVVTDRANASGNHLLAVLSIRYLFRKDHHNSIDLEPDIKSDL
jgi:hypothetical protein